MDAGYHTKWNKSERQIPHDITYMWNLQCDTNELIYKTEKDSKDIKNRVCLQARTLEWVAVSFSNAWKWKVKVKSLSCVWLFVTPWTAAYQAPPYMGFSRQEYWSGVPSPSPTSGCNFFKFILEFWTSLFKSIKTHRTTISMSMHFGWIFGKNAILPYLKHNNRKP